MFRVTHCYHKPPKATKVVWLDARGEKRTIETSHLPPPEMETALDALIPFVIEVCDLPPKYSKHMKAIGISASFHGDAEEEIRATVSVIKTVRHSNSPLNLSTPHANIESHSKQFEELTVVCEKFAVDGERAQGELDLEPNGESE